MKKTEARQNAEMRLDAAAPRLRKVDIHSPFLGTLPLLLVPITVFALTRRYHSASHDAPAGISPRNVILPSES